MLQRVKEDGNILQAIKIRKAKLIGHIWRTKFLLQHIIKGNIEGRIVVTARGGCERKQLLNDIVK
jgi:hypothetical protein